MLLTSGIGNDARRIAPLVLISLALVTAACSRTTGTLSDEQQLQLDGEGIVRQAVDLEFRRTHDLGMRDAGWEDVYASIVVTRSSVLIHDRARVLLEITPRSTGAYDVARDHDRLSLRAGRGGSTRSWSFRPSDDPEGWLTTSAPLSAQLRARSGVGDEWVAPSDTDLRSRAPRRGRYHGAVGDLHPVAGRIVTASRSRSRGGCCPN